MKSIKEIKQSYEKKMLKIDGVVGVGLGKEEGKDVIVILTDQLSERSRKKIPSELKGYKVIMRETGRIEAK